MADLLDVTFTGTGVLGEITAASVSNSEATSSSPTDNPAQIATVSVTGKTTDRSVFLADSSLTVNMNGTGNMTGRADTVQIGHATTNVSGPNGLSRFITGNINVPAVRSGDPAGALDLAMQLSGEKRFTNNYTGPGTLVDTNLAENPNASLDTVGWYGQLGGGGDFAATRYSSGGPSPVDTYASSLATGSGTYLDVRYGGVGLVPRAAGQPFVVSAKVQSDVVLPFTIYVQFYDASNTIISTSASSLGSTTSSWTTKVGSSFTSPTGTVRVGIVFRITGSIASGNHLDVSQVKAGANTTYFSGDTPYDGVNLYAWLGTPNRSASGKYTPAVSTSPQTQFWSLNGHDAGFGVSGNRVVSVDLTRYQSVEGIGGSFVGGLNGTSPTPPLFTIPYFSATTQKTYAKQITYIGPAVGGVVAGGPGGTFADLSDPNTKKVWNFVYPPDRGDEFLDVRFGYREADVGPATVRFYLKPSTSNMVVTYDSIAAPGGNKTLTFNTSALGTEWLVSSTFNWVATTGALQVSVSMSNTDGSNKTTQTFTAINYSVYPVLLMQQADEGVPTARLVRWDTIPVSWVGWDAPYEIATAADIQTTPAVTDAPIQGYFGPVWTYLNQVCAGSDTEIALVNDVVTLRSLRTETLSIVNRNSQYTVTPQSNKAEKVTLSWSEFRAGNGLTFTPNTVYSVNVGETSEVLIQTANSFTWAPQPKPVDASDFISNLDQIGYAVSGSDNLPIPALEWLDYGGSIQVSPTNVVGELKLTLHGPPTEIPGVSAPYSLSISDGSTSYPALNIQFWGTAFDEATDLTMNTGAAPSTTTQIEPVTFTSVWATSRERVWGVLSKGAKRYAGAYPTLNMTVPTRDANGFGLCEGSVFRFMNSDYRVTSVTFQIGTTTVTAEPTTTIASFETVWAGKTFAQFETFWSADTYTFTDFTQAPLTTEW